MTRVGSTEIIVISPIDATNEGPKVPIGKKGWQSIHLRQGTMDGACGLYSLMMGLIIGGVVRFDEVCSLAAFSSKSKIKKLIDYFQNFGPLVNKGINLDEMYEVISEVTCEHYPGKIDFQGYKRNKGVDLVDFIETEISNNHPILLLVTFEGGGHWVLVVGCEYERRGVNTVLCRFLILDPSGTTPIMCSWNGVINARKQKGKYPYCWWTEFGNVKVQLEYTLAIWSKKTNE